MGPEEKFVQFTAILAEFREQVGCLICHGLLDNPHSVPGCKHQFCLACIKGALEGKGITKSQCPVCRTPVWVRDLTPVHHLSSLVDVFRSLSNIASNASIQHPPADPDDCEGAPASSAQLRGLAEAAAAGPSGPPPHRPQSPPPMPASLGPQDMDPHPYETPAPEDDGRMGDGESWGQEAPAAASGPPGVPPAPAAVEEPGATRAARRKSVPRCSPAPTDPIRAPEREPKPAAPDFTPPSLAVGPSLRPPQAGGPQPATTGPLEATPAASQRAAPSSAAGGSISFGFVIPGSDGEPSQAQASRLFGPFGPTSSRLGPAGPSPIQPTGLFSSATACPIGAAAPPPLPIQPPQPEAADHAQPVASAAIPTASCLLQHDGPRPSLLPLLHAEAAPAVAALDRPQSPRPEGELVMQGPAGRHSDHSNATTDVLTASQGQAPAAAAAAPPPPLTAGAAPPRRMPRSDTATPDLDRVARGIIRRLAALGALDQAARVVESRYREAALRSGRLECSMPLSLLWSQWGLTGEPHPDDHPPSPSAGGSCGNSPNTATQAAGTVTKALPIRQGLDPGSLPSAGSAPEERGEAHQWRSPPGPPPGVPLAASTLKPRADRPLRPLVVAATLEEAEEEEPVLPAPNPAQHQQPEGTWPPDPGAEGPPPTAGAPTDGAAQSGSPTCRMRDAAAMVLTSPAAQAPALSAYLQPASTARPPVPAFLEAAAAPSATPIAAPPRGPLAPFPGPSLDASLLSEQAARDRSISYSPRHSPDPDPQGPEGQAGAPEPSVPPVPHQQASEERPGPTADPKTAEPTLATAPVAAYPQGAVAPAPRVPLPTAAPPAVMLPPEPRSREASADPLPSSGRFKRKAQGERAAAAPRQAVPGPAAAPAAPPEAAAPRAATPGPLPKSGLFSRPLTQRGANRAKTEAVGQEARGRQPPPAAAPTGRPGPAAPPSPPPRVRAPKSTSAPTRAREEAMEVDPVGGAKGGQPPPVEEAQPPPPAKKKQRLEGLAGRPAPPRPPKAAEGAAAAAATAAAAVPFASFGSDLEMITGVSRGLVGASAAPPADPASAKGPSAPAQPLIPAPLGGTHFALDTKVFPVPGTPVALVRGIREVPNPASLAHDGPADPLKVLSFESTAAPSKDDVIIVPTRLAVVPTGGERPPRYALAAAHDDAGAAGEAEYEVESMALDPGLEGFPLIHGLVSGSRVVTARWAVDSMATGVAQPLEGQYQGMEPYFRVRRPLAGVTLCLSPSFSGSGPGAGPRGPRGRADERRWTHTVELARLLGAVTFDCRDLKEPDTIRGLVSRAQADAARDRGERPDWLPAGSLVCLLPEPSPEDATYVLRTCLHAAGGARGQAQAQGLKAGSGAARARAPFRAPGPLNSGQMGMGPGGGLVNMARSPGPGLPAIRFFSERWLVDSVLGGRLMEAEGYEVTPR